MKIILASASPRRKELLGLITTEFDVVPSNIDEKLQIKLTPQEQVTRLAYIKAKDVFDQTRGDRVVIGSDTIVVKNGKIYGKPHNREEAKIMIRELLLDNRIHSVITGLAVLIEQNGIYKEYKIYDEVRVYLKEITECEIEKWIDTGKAMDKAAAYGIQNEFGVYVEKIDGNYNTVVGLPIHKLYDILKENKCI